MSYLVDQAVKALTSGVSVQSAVRDFIDSKLEQGFDKAEVGQLVADEVAKFKTRAETMNSVEAPEETTQDFRKQTNNIINDISRLTREKIGLSIRLKSRRDGYVYAASEPVARKVRTVAEPVDVPLDMEKAYTFIKDNPLTVLEWLYKEHGKDDFGRMAVDVLKSNEPEE